MTVSRCAPEWSRWRSCRHAVCMMLVAGVAAGGAQAQTAPSDESVSGSARGRNRLIAEPVVGLAPLSSSPLSIAAVDNQPRFTLVPSVRTLYDSNALHYVDLSGGPRDNMRVTPGLDLDYRRQFGRVAASISGSAGYDFNSRFRFLNQRRIDFTGSARAPVGSVCATTASASYDQFRFDPGDTQAPLQTTSRAQYYDVIADCRRAAGFSPVAEVSFRSLDSDRSSFFNYKQYVESIGVAYAQPSIGVVKLAGTVAQLRRPDLAMLIGLNDDTDVYSLGLGLDRSVSPRFRINVSGGLTRADPRRASVPSFLGGSYNGVIEWVPTPRFTATVTALREITNQNGVSATYVIREIYMITAQWEVSAKSQFSLSGNHAEHDYRGQDLTPALLPIRADQSTSFGANYNYELSRKLRLGFGLNHSWRDADNPFYNYKSTTLSSSIGARF